MTQPGQLNPSIGAGAVNTLDLPVAAGPWLADVWLMDRPLRTEASGSLACAVAGCGRAAGQAEGDKHRDTDVLCVAHRNRYRKARKVPLPQFIEEQAGGRPILEPRGAQTRKPHYPPVDFTRVHARLAHEIRFVTSRNLRNCRWTDRDHVNTVLRCLLALGECFEIESLLQYPLSELQEMLASKKFADFRGGSVGRPRNLELALPAMIKMLDRATLDPWDSDRWQVDDLNYPKEIAGSLQIIYWTKVTAGWLRDGLRSYCRQALQTRTRSWSTIHTYVRGAALLTRFFEEEAGPIQPEELTRRLFLDFVHWVGEQSATGTDRNAVNSIAKILVHLRVGGYVPDLPDTTFLLRGENVVPKNRSPKPFPDDVLTAIDVMIVEDTELTDDIRLMLRLFRAAGPRASELLMLSTDSLCHTKGRGYSIEYFMSKTDNWRRIPIPDRLGQDLATQVEKITAQFGGACQWMFPYTGRSSRAKTLAKGVFEVLPWSYTKFTRVVWNAYQRNGITKSSTTGETLTGPNVHRFRHSIATGLLNEGWSQYEVQKFLGHKSPTMMQSYAEIHDDTLRTKYEEYAKHAIDITGTKHTITVKDAADRERLRDRMVRTTLPNGYCTLPEKQTCDFAPTPCLSCKPFFRTTPTFLPVHIRQRDETMRQLELSRKDGRQRAIEAQEKTLDRLNVIIDGLEHEKAGMQHAEVQIP